MSRVRGKVPEGSSPIFVDTEFPLSTLVEISLRAKIISIRPAVSIGHRLVTDTVRQTQTDTGP